MCSEVESVHAGKIFRRVSDVESNGKVKSGRRASKYGEERMYTGKQEGTMTGSVYVWSVEMRVNSMTGIEKPNIINPSFSRGINSTIGRNLKSRNAFFVGKAER